MEDTVTEESPLLSSSRSTNCEQHGKPLKIAIVCFILIAVFAIALVLIAVSLYGFVYAAISHSTSGTTLAEQGDYVLLDYRISKYGFAIFEYVLQFTVFPVDSVQLISIYEVPCSSLLDKTKRISVFNNPNSISSNQKYYFSNCSNGICVLDQFVYQAVSSESRIDYNITLSSFIRNKTEILIVAYDNLQYFQKFLNGTIPSKSIKQFYANDIDFTFNLSTRDMKRSSYYFFAIKSITGSSGWFTVERSGLHVYYNASNLSPKCVINNGCNCSCEVKISNNKQCFLGHMQQHTNENNSSKKIYSIRHAVTEPKMGYLIIPEICILFALIIIITIFAIGCSLFFRKKRQAAIGPLGHQSIRHTQTTLVSDALMVDFQDSHSCLKAAVDDDLPIGSTEKQASPHGILRDGLESCSFNSSTVQHEPGMQSRDKCVQDESAHELAKDHLSGESAKSDQVPLVNSNNPMITPIKEPNAFEEHMTEAVLISHPQAVPCIAEEKEVIVNASKSTPCEPEKYYEIEKVTFDENGLFYHSEDHGATIIIPEGAVQGAATLQFEASLLMVGFDSESAESGDFLPVSPFLWVHTDPVLSKPAELYIPHYAIANTTEDKNKLVLLTKGHEENSFFKVNDQLELTILETTACIRATHFCSLCIATFIQKGSLPKLRYNMVSAQKVVSDNLVNIDICILYSMKCFQNLQNYYNREGFIIDSVNPLFCGISNNGVEICIDVPEDADWECSSRGTNPKKIHAEDIDMLHFLECKPDSLSEEDKEDMEKYEQMGSYPPRFKLTLYSKSSPAKKCSVRITSCGLEKEFSVSIVLGLSKDNSDARSSFSQDQCPPSPLTSDSTPISRNSDEDAFIFIAMPVLESVLTDSTSCLKFGYCLGLRMDDLHKIESTYGHDIKRCVKQVLFHWRFISPQSTYKELSRALEASGYPVASAMLTRRCSMNKQESAAEEEGYVVIEEPRVKEFGAKNREQSTEFDILCQVLTSVPNGSVILQSEPSLADLENLVAAKLPAKWMLFGTQVNIERHTLEEIERDNNGKSRQCFNKLFDVWRKSESSPFTWETVIKALYSPAVSEHRVAETVYKHILPCLSSVTTSN